MTIHAVFNFWEGWFWIGLGAGVLVASMVRQKRVGWFFVALGGVLVLFGFSDFVEMRTGAWYRPWWLLGWKSCCVVGMVVMWLIYRQRMRKEE